MAIDFNLGRSGFGALYKMENDEWWEANRPERQPEELPNYTVIGKPQTAAPPHLCKHGISYDKTCDACLRVFGKVIRLHASKAAADGHRVRDAGSAAAPEWFAPGDTFCKRCNVVYSDPTPTGQCSICYGRMLAVSDF